MLKTAYKFEFYHGTSSTHLSQILKTGLEPNPKTRVWDKDYDKNKRRPGELGLDSFPGVYMTNNFMVAYAAAGTAVGRFGGNRLIVIGAAETRSPEVKVDEDHVDEPGRGVAIQDKLVADWYRSIRLLDFFTFDASDEELANISKTWVEKALGVKPTQEVLRTAGLALRAWLDMRVALEYEKEKTGQDWNGLKGKLKERFGDSIPQKFNEPVAAIKKYRDAIDVFLGKAKDLAEKQKDQFIANIRIEKPVSYGGANRIMAVVEIILSKPDAEEKDIIVVRYAAGNDGRDAVMRMLEHYTNNIGVNFEVEW